MIKRIHITIDKEALRKLCRRYHLKRLAFFGSVLRDDFRHDSDIDVLVEFEEGHTPGFFKLYEFEQKLSEILDGRKVDLVTYRALNRHLKSRVLAEAEVQYAEG